MELLLASLLSLPPAGDRVILVHGMGRSRASLVILAWRLRRAGFRPVLFPYCQASEDVEQATERLIDAAAGGKGRYHLVGHSLGNILIRNGFRKGFPQGLGRVVMLAPPNAPAVMAGRLRRWTLYRWIAGDAGQKLSDPSFYSGLPVPDVEFAVLSGDKGWRIVGPEPNDGVITVRSTRLRGAKAELTLHRTHTFIMNAPETGRAVAAFLRTGRL